MKHRSILRALALVLVMAALLGGCSKEQPDPSDPILPDGLPLPWEEHEVLATITDSATLAEAWDPLLFNASYSFQDGFADYDELTTIEVLTFLRYCALHEGDWVSDGPFDDAFYENMENQLSKERALALAGRYFGRDVINDENYPDLYTDAATGMEYYLGFQKGPDYDTPAYDAGEPFRLTKIEQVTERDYIAFVERIESRDGETVVVRNQCYYLGRHDDGTFYLTGGVSRWDEYYDAELSGELTHFDTVLGRSAQRYYSLELLGEPMAVGERLLFVGLQNNNYAAEYKSSATGESLLTRELTVDGQNLAFASLGETIHGALYRNDCLVITSSRALYLFDGDLEFINRVPLPVVIGEAYDVSDDLTQVVACNDSGVSLINLAENSSELLLAHPNADGDEEQQVRYVTAGFVQGDSKIFAMANGYEWTDSFALYDLAQRSVITYPAPYSRLLYSSDDGGAVILSADEDFDHNVSLMPSRLAGDDLYFVEQSEREDGKQVYALKIHSFETAEDSPALFTAVTEPHGYIGEFDLLAILPDGRALIRYYFLGTFGYGITAG